MRGIVVEKLLQNTIEKRSYYQDILLLNKSQENCRLRERKRIFIFLYLIHKGKTEGDQWLMK